MDNNVYFNKFGVVVEFRSTTGAMHAMHSHDYYEIYILTSGRRNYFIENKFLRVNENEVVLVKSGLMHKTSGTLGNRILITVKKEFLERYFTKLTVKNLLACFDKVHIKLNAKNLETIVKSANALRGNIDNGVDTNNYVYMFDIFKTLNEEENVEFTENVFESNLNAIIDYINKNYHAIKGLDEIAEKFYLSKSYLCRSFKTQTGVNFITYLNKIRLKKAVEFLISTKLSISQIAKKTGFNSANYFCNLFREEYKITPLAYRKNLHFNYSDPNTYDGRDSIKP